MDSHHMNTPPINGGQGPVIKPISGKKLAKALKAGTVQPGFAAWLAYKLQTGEAYLHHLTAKQSRQITGAKCSDLAAERRDQRQANGNGHARVLYRRDPSDADVDAIVSRVGADRVMAALDRATKPRCDATSEMFAR